jgi:hypothetical protein
MSDEKVEAAEIERFWAGFEAKTKAVDAAYMAGRISPEEHQEWSEKLSLMRLCMPKRVRGEQ